MTPDQEAALLKLLPVEPVWTPKPAPTSTIKDKAGNTYTSTNGTKEQLIALLESKGIKL